jgi:hypothetical protein
MKALTPASRHFGPQVSPLISPHLPNVPPPTTRCAPVSLYTPTSAYRASFGLRHERAGSSSHPAESSSLYCGPPVRIRLLSTPSRDDAVTFSYGALAYPDTDLHRADVAPLRAHSSPRRRGPRCAALTVQARGSMRLCWIPARGNDGGAETTQKTKVGGPLPHPLGPRRHIHHKSVPMPGAHVKKAQAGGAGLCPGRDARWRAARFSRPAASTPTAW